MSDAKANAQKAIHAASVAAAGVAASPIPFSDAVLLVPIQTTMIVAIYKAYGEDIPEGIIKGVVKSTFATTIGRSAASNLMKMIPDVGTVAGVAVGAGVAVAITEAIGYTLVRQFETGSGVDIEDLGSVIGDAINTVRK